MGMMDFLKKPKAEEPFTEINFECKRGPLCIRGTEYRPEGENLPVAIVSHGFMAWQDTVRQYAKEQPEAASESDVRSALYKWDFYFKKPLQ